ncbi:hypothetical protein [Pontibacter chinhatensis]|uniref:Uncharacterized protein n=1 Tax=Pontibacter chinhatensis TaxID=1436961 RepID=A0A1I2TY85_9BACT|nr:hypothetical protein [Pontibacter chinhatensis]SFG67321.1 hypothetical protein SAMN05421739_103241 [Pontibacter chinhatensis]
MIRDLNKLDLMIAALYLRYRRRDDHWLSAFWTKLFFGFLGMVWSWCLFEWSLYLIGLPRPEFIHEPYLIGIVYGHWILSGFIIHIFTLSFEDLSTIDLYPEDYIRGNKLAFYLTIITIVIVPASLMWLDKQ